MEQKLDNKSFLVTALILVAGCRPPINVEAPTLVRVENVAALSLTDEPTYVPTVRWNMWAYIPNRTMEFWGSNEEMPNGDMEIDNHIFKWGPMTAITTLEGRKLRLDCSNGSAATFTCLVDGAEIKATCERMVFKFTCIMR